MVQSAGVMVMLAVLEPGYPTEMYGDPEVALVKTNAKFAIGYDGLFSRHAESAVPLMRSASAMSHAGRSGRIGNSIGVRRV